MLCSSGLPHLFLSCRPHTRRRRCPVLHLPCRCVPPAQNICLSHSLFFFFHCAPFGPFLLSCEEKATADPLSEDILSPHFFFLFVKCRGPPICSCMATFLRLPFSLFGLIRGSRTRTFFPGLGSTIVLPPWAGQLLPRIHNLRVMNEIHSHRCAVPLLRPIRTTLN